MNMEIPNNTPGYAAKPFGLVNRFHVFRCPCGWIFEWPNEQFSQHHILNHIHSHQENPAIVVTETIEWKRL